MASSRVSPRLGFLMDDKGGEAFRGRPPCFSLRRITLPAHRHTHTTFSGFHSKHYKITQPNIVGWVTGWLQAVMSFFSLLMNHCCSLKYICPGNSQPPTQSDLFEPPPNSACNHANALMMGSLKTNKNKRLVALDFFHGEQREHGWLNWWQLELMCAITTCVEGVCVHCD